MPRANIETGTFANDGTGDTLRAAATKINQNFVELYTSLGDSDNAFVNISFGNRAVVFEDASNFKTTLTSNGTQPEDITITLPDSTGVVTLNSATQTLTNKTLDATTLITPFIQESDGSNTFKIVGSDIPSNKVVRIPNLVGLDSSTLVFADLVQTLTNKTLDNAILNTPKIDQILGTNDIGALQFGLGASDRISVTAGTTSRLQTVGSSTDISMELRTKGAGVIKLKDGPADTDLATLEVGKLTTNEQQSLQFDQNNVSLQSGPAILDTNYMINVIDSAQPLSSGFIANVDVGKANSVRYIVNNTSFNATLTLSSSGKFDDLSGTKIIPPNQCYKFVVVTEATGVSVRNWFKVT